MRNVQTSLQNIETSKDHHLAGPFRPQTPLALAFGDSPTSDSPTRSKFLNRAPVFDPFSTTSQGLWNDLKSMRWVVVPTSSLKMIIIGVALWANWEILRPYTGNFPNPFSPLLFIQGRIPESPPDDPRYAKSFYDLLFIAFHIIVFSFFRQFITIWICQPVGRWFGIKKEGKLARFGEQVYAMVYFAIMGLWGIRIMSESNTWWYDTKHFWIGYPHWNMKPMLKRYYLMQASYWCQQLIVLLLNLEKPRKDYYELVAHHFVTLWLVGWSYLINLTQIGNAVYVSMDVPDTWLALSKILNYLQWEYTKIAVFVLFLGIWTYFRIYLNMVMLHSVWTEFDLMPITSMRWSPPDGVWLVWWMKYQVFVPLLLLLFLNLFWYFLILRILYRVFSGPPENVTDVRSDDEDDDDDKQNDKEE